MRQREKRVTPEERLAIDDVIGRYVWAVDSGDVDGVVAQFTPEAIVRYGDGQRYEGIDALHAFARRAIGGPSARGRMHIAHPLFAERVGDDILLHSYLMVPQWVTDDEEVAVRTLRYVEDRFRLTDKGWRIDERAIFLWNGTAMPDARKEEGGSDA